MTSLARLGVSGARKVPLSYTTNRNLNTNIRRTQ